jgi:hypothetical protein
LPAKTQIAEMPYLPLSEEAARAHEYRQEAEHRSAPFWSDIFVPLIGFILLLLRRRYEIEWRSAAPYPWLRRA